MEEKPTCDVKLQQIIEEKEAIINRIIQSKSWKWTRWLRILEARLRRFLHREKLVSAPTDFAYKLNPHSGIAIIIPCHNYGKYLGDCIESALNQTILPSEILVVDDSSSDDTLHIATLYHERGVRYIRCNHGHPSDARNEGTKHTLSPFLLFLDADDMLDSDYIEKCLECMKDPSVAIAYGDMKHFGNEKRVFGAPEFDREELMRRNYISSHALMRRQVFDLVGGYRITPNTPNEDWDLYRRMLKYSWTAKKARTSVLYRKHDKNRLPTFDKNKLEYW